MTLIDNNESTKYFTKYFKQEHSQHKYQWDTCHQKTAGINFSHALRVAVHPLILHSVPADGKASVRLF